MDAWTSGIAFGLLGTLLGGLIGHRLALGRDRRLEYNNLKRPLLQSLQGYIFQTQEGIYSVSPGQINTGFFTSVYPYLSSSQKKNLVKDICKLDAAIESAGAVDDYGNLSCNDPDSVIHALEKLKKYVMLK